MRGSVGDPGAPGNPGRDGKSGPTGEKVIKRKMLSSLPIFKQNF